MTAADETKPLMTRSWDEIEDHYRELADTDAKLGGMLQLVEAIRASAYARALHAWTSMCELCIVQVPCTYPCDGPYLCVSPRSDGTIEFRNIDTHVVARQWHRIVRSEEAFRRLERFMQQLHWTPRRRPA